MKFKEFINEHKKDMMIGVLSIGSLVLLGIVFKQRMDTSMLKGEMSNLINYNKDLRHDVNILSHVMDGTVLSSLEESITRKLRYAEGRLANGLKSGVISDIDIQKRKEEIIFYSDELKKVAEAKKLLKTIKRD